MPMDCATLSAFVVGRRVILVQHLTERTPSLLPFFCASSPVARRGSNTHRSEWPSPSNKKAP
jgi:hypothetical protein